MLCVVHEFGDAAGCTVHTMGSYVIVADSVKNCVAKDCGSVGIVGDQVADIRGESTGSYGINTNYTAQNCYGSSSGTSLIATSANNCYGSGITYGLYAFYTASGCTGNSNTSAGLYALIANGLCRVLFMPYLVAGSKPASQPFLSLNLQTYGTPVYVFDVYSF